MCIWVRAALIATLLSVASGARADFVSDYEDRLAVADLAGAKALAEDRLRADAGDNAARFALGTAEFLLAAEHLMQGLYNVGLRSDMGSRGFLGGIYDLPFLRLPVPANLKPEPATYERLNGILGDFVGDLAKAKATLQDVTDAPFELTLRLNRVHFDIDGDGVAGDDEGLGRTFSAITGARSTILFPAKDFPVTFDNADAVWMEGYTHLLSAMAEIPLAHDWRSAYDVTLHGVFPATEFPSSELFREEMALREFVGNQVPGWGYQWDRSLTPEENWRLRAEWEATPEGKKYLEITSANSALQFGGIADLIALVHQFSFPLSDPARMQSARQHLLSMVSLSRESWQLILAETDDNREWIPGPGQTNILNNLRVDAERLKGWNLFLDEFEAILEGRKLIPHWRIGGTRGVNVKRMFDEPQRLDPVLIAQGSAILPYLENGELADSNTFRTIMGLMDGALLGYFIWFN